MDSVTSSDMLIPTITQIFIKSLKLNLTAKIVQLEVKKTVSDFLLLASSFMKSFIDNI
jgi:hypothetical protein